MIIRHSGFWQVHLSFGTNSPHVDSKLKSALKLSPAINLSLRADETTIASFYPG